MSLNDLKRGTTARGEAVAAPIGFSSVLGALAFLVTVVSLLAIGFMIGRAVFFRTPASRNVAPRDARSTSLTQAVVPGSSFPVSSSILPSAGRIEVPDLRGMRADEAVVLLQTAGFAVFVRDVGLGVTSEASRTVISQVPSSGTVAAAESTVTISAPALRGVAASAGADSSSSVGAPRLVVCIDPGHQAHSDSKLEPLGPGSKTQRPRATGGVTGVSTGIPEFETDLQLAVNLKKRLEAAGVKVVMTRTTNDVSLSNAMRARIANRAHADLFVRIHGAASPNPADSGVTTIYSAKNRWTTKYTRQSIAAAKDIETWVCTESGAANRGAHPQSGLVGSNWAREPSVIVETGFLSNPVEDKLLSSANYQDRLARGLASGILMYLGESQH